MLQPLPRSLHFGELLDAAQTGMQDNGVGSEPARNREVDASAIRAEGRDVMPGGPDACNSPDPTAAGFHVRDLEGHPHTDRGLDPAANPWGNGSGLSRDRPDGRAPARPPAKLRNERPDGVHRSGDLDGSSYRPHGALSSIRAAMAVTGCTPTGTGRCSALGFRSNLANLHDHQDDEATAHCPPDGANPVGCDQATHSASRWIVGKFAVERDLDEGRRHPEHRQHRSRR